MKATNRIQTSRAVLLLGTLSMINLCCSDNDNKKVSPAQGTKPAVAAQPGQPTLTAALVSELPADCSQLRLGVSGLKLATKDGKETQILPVATILEMRRERAGASVRTPLIQAHGLDRKDFTSLVLLLEPTGHSVALDGGTGPQVLALPEQLIKNGIPVPVLGDLGGASTGELQITFRAAGSVLRSAGPGGLVLHPQMWATRLGGCVSLEGRVTDPQGRPLPHHPVTAQVPAGTTLTAAGTTVLRSTVTDTEGRYRLDGLPRAASLTWNVVTPPFPYLEGFYGLNASPVKTFKQSGDPSKHSHQVVVHHHAQTGHLDGIIQRRRTDRAHFEVDILQVWRPETAPAVPAGPAPAAGADTTFQVASLRPDLVQGETPSRFSLPLPPGNYQVRLRLVTLGDDGTFTRADCGGTQACTVAAGGRAVVTFPAR